MEPRRWWELWTLLCGRFGRHPDQPEAAAYLEYLEVMLDPEEIEEATRVVWADREFFPRPVDFVLAAHAGVLFKLRAAAGAWHAKEKHWNERLGVPGGMAHKVLRELGGITVVHQLMERGPYPMRREVEHTVSEVLRLQSRQLPPLLSAGDRPKLPSLLKP